MIINEKNTYQFHLEIYSYYHAYFEIIIVDGTLIYSGSDFYVLQELEVGTYYLKVKDNYLDHPTKYRLFIKKVN